MLTPPGSGDKLRATRAPASGPAREGVPPCRYRPRSTTSAPTSVGNALELLERHGPEARVIAGGHSLLPMMKLRLARPEWLIDINDLAELRHITDDGDQLRVGALTRHAALLGLRRRRPALPDRARRRAGDRRPRRPQPGHDRRLARPGRPGRGPDHGLRRPARPGGHRRPRRASGGRHRRVPPRPLRDRVRAARADHRDPLPDRRPLGQRLREGRAPGRGLGGRCRRRGRHPRDGRHDRRRRDRADRPRAGGLATDAAAVLRRAAARRGPVRRGRPARRARPAPRSRTSAVPSTTSATSPTSSPAGSSAARSTAPRTHRRQGGRPCRSP